MWLKQRGQGEAGKGRRKTVPQKIAGRSSTERVLNLIIAEKAWTLRLLCEKHGLL